MAAVATTQILSAATGDRSAALRAPPVEAVDAPPVVGAGEVLLPSFVRKRPGGLYVDPTDLGMDGRFTRFVESVFSADSYFSGLEFGNFNRLLYDVEHAANDAEPIRLAAGIRPFTVERKALYRPVRTGADGSFAEYVFEKVFLEIAEPASEKPDGAGDGDAPIDWTKKPVKAEPAKLDFDEFVAHLWIQGVRAGIDESAVRRIINKGDTGKLTVARWIEPTTGKDAGIEEKTKSLHRDNSPKISRNGNADLGQFKNRFPQVVKDEALLRKTPRVPGEPGRKVNGEIVEPKPPADFELLSLAGPGTRIEQRRDGEYILASIAGFVNLDTSSNQISITEKIVGREGVSVRTTGNLSLSGDDYEEFGEVQEQRVVEGKNMTFHADVFGSLVSRGGLILLEHNLTSGKASNPGGEIVAHGRPSASVLEAPKGKIHLKHAEGCTISGSDVTVDSATFCHIVGERVQVGTAAGCSVTGQSVTIAESKSHKGKETVCAMLVPNLSANDEKRTAVRKRLAEVAAELDEQRKKAAALRGQKEFGSFLMLQSKIAKGEIKVAPAQEAHLIKLATRFSPMMQELRAFGEAIGRIQKTHAEIEEQLKTLDRERESMGAEVQCAITSVAGETVVRTLQYDLSGDFMSGDGLKELLTRVRSLDRSPDRLFMGDTGRFDWQYKPAAECPAKPD